MILQFRWYSVSILLTGTVSGQTKREKPFWILSLVRITFADTNGIVWSPLLRETLVVRTSDTYFTVISTDAYTIRRCNVHGQTQSCRLLADTRYHGTDPSLKRVHMFSKARVLYATKNGRWQNLQQVIDWAKKVVACDGSEVHNWMHAISNIQWK